MSGVSEIQLAEALLRPGLGGEIEQCLLDAHTLVLRFRRPLAELAAYAAAPHAAAPAPPCFQRRGKGWHLFYQGRESYVPGLLGFTYLHELLRHPNEDLAAEQLTSAASFLGKEDDRAALAETLNLAGEGDLGDVVDAQALGEGRKRLRELERQINRATDFGDEVTAANLRKERTQLVDYLAAALGLGGRRRKAGSKRETNRQAVKRAISRACAEIERQDPDLALFLSESIVTGSFCRYRHSGHMAWQL